MIVKNRWFILQGPVRADLSGRPWGFRFIWKPQEAEGPQHFLQNSAGWEFGFYLPSLLWLYIKNFPEKYEILDCAQLLDAQELPPHEWRKWPYSYRRAAESAVTVALAARPGARIISDRSYCDLRADLSGRPIQLYRIITLKLAA